jgi:polyisoprenoid-binding protein YceI
MRIAGLVLAGILAVTAPAAVRAEPYVLDKSHAFVGFGVSHIGFSTVLGYFTAFDAEIDFDPGNVEATRVNFTIDASSVQTFWEARDRDLKSRNFLDVANHPYITFTTTSVVPTDTDAADVTGDITILGVTRPITLKARLNKLAPSPFNRNTTIAGFTVTGEIDRTEFGMTYGAPAIGAKVSIRLELEITPAR